MTDPIADFLTRVRNAYLAGKKVVEIPSSKMKVALTKILCEKGYILSYKVVEGTPCNTIKIALKYHPQTKTAAIKKIVRVSKPGQWILLRVGCVLHCIPALNPQQG